MYTRNLRVLICAIAILLLAVALPAAAAPAATDGSGASLPQLFADVWGWLLDAVTGEQGPIMDPNGSNIEGGDQGPIMDPNGNNMEGGEQGPIMDPNG